MGGSLAMAGRYRWECSIASDEVSVAKDTLYMYR